MYSYEKYRERVITKVKEILSSIKGVRVICELNEEERREVLEIERKAEEKAADGFLRCYNAGIRAVLDKEVVLAVLHDENYQYPPEVIELLYGGEVIGEEIRDKEKLEELRNRRDVLILGETFVIYKNRLPTEYRRRAVSGEIYIFIPPMSVKELRDVEEIYGVTEGMPSTPADCYLKEILRSKGVDVSHPRLGVALVGFNIIYKEI